MGQGNYIDHFTKLASDYGPFLFAILFTLLVPARVHASYRSALLEFPSPSEDQEQLIKETRVYFRATWIAGFFLVAISVGWWIVQNWQNLVNDTSYQVAYSGVIFGVNEADKLDGATGEPVYLMKMDIGQDHYYKFIALEKKPLTKDHSLVLRWISLQQVNGQASGYGGKTVLFTMRPHVTAYEFKVNGTSVSIDPSTEPGNPAQVTVK